MSNYLKTEDLGIAEDVPKIVISPVPPDQGEIAQLVFEYLELNGLDKTLGIFVEECKTKSLPFPEHESSFPFTHQGGQRMLECFDNGDLSGFLKQWKAFLGHIRVADEGMKKMEVYCRVYFTVYPFTHDHGPTECKSAMQKLKSYFDNGSFPEEITMLPMFNLPYVPNALDQPMFNELITPGWADKVRYQLETTIFRYFYMIRENTEAHAKYSAVLLKAKLKEQKLQKQQQLESNAIDFPVPSYYQKQFNQLAKTFRKVRRLLRGTRESYGRLLKVAHQLICGLESTVAGNAGGLASVVQNCYEIFPELFTSDLTPHGVPDTEYFKQLAADAFFDSVIDSDVSLFFMGISDMSPELLDYAKIKETLGSEDMGQGNSNKLCLLQALRWLLTRSPTSCKNYAMASFIGCDLLGLLDSNSEFRNRLFSCMTSKTPTYLRESLIRLTSCFSSTKSGRKYLSSTNFIVDTLTHATKTMDAQTEKYNCQMIIATFQKMSLRKAMRLRMIENGLILWLAKYLTPEIMKIENVEVLPAIEVKSPRTVNQLPLHYNPYLMEFGWTLLMNLCLHEEASTEVGQDLIACALKMLRVKPTVDVIPYVVSTLYNLIRNKLTFENAVEMNLASQLTEIISHGIDGDNAVQLESIIRMLKGVGKESDHRTGLIDYDDEQDEEESLDPELEVPETWVKALDPKTLVGDELLSHKYLIKRAPPEPVLPEFNVDNTTSIKSPRSTEIIMRPMTPNISKKTLSSRKAPAPSLPCSEEVYEVQPLDKSYVNPTNITKKLPQRSNKPQQCQQPIEEPYGPHAVPDMSYFHSRSQKSDGNNNYYSNLSNSFKAKVRLDPKRSYRRNQPTEMTTFHNAEHLDHTFSAPRKPRSKKNGIGTHSCLPKLDESQRNPFELYVSHPTPLSQTTKKKKKLPSCTASNGPTAEISPPLQENIKIARTPPSEQEVPTSVQRSTAGRKGKPRSRVNKVTS